MATPEQLFEAIQAGDQAEVDRLLGKDASLARASNVNGLSALMWAKYHRQDAIVKVLIDSGVPLDLFALASVGDADQARKYLQKHPSSTTKRSPDGFTALHLACYFGQAELVRLLLKADSNPNSIAENGSRLQPIHSAVANGSLDAVEALIAAGADIQAKQAGGWTALHAAAKHGNKAIVQLFINAGADVQATSDDGKTAHDLAEDPQIATLIEASIQASERGGDS